jgi:hypothetical protein
MVTPKTDDKTTDKTAIDKTPKEIIRPMSRQVYFNSVGDDGKTRQQGPTEIVESAGYQLLERS